MGLSYRYSHSRSQSLLGACAWHEDQEVLGTRDLKSLILGLSVISDFLQHFLQFSKS